MIFALLAASALSLLDFSATRAFRTPWWLIFLLVQMVPLIVTAGVVCRRTLHGPVEKTAAAGIGLLWLGSLASACVSPYRAESLAGSPAILFWLATGIATACLLSPAGENFVARIHKIRTAVAWALLAVLAASFFSWLGGDLIPGLRQGALLQRELGPEAWSFSWGSIRNAHPFGHSNYTAGAAVLMIPWFCGLAWSRPGRARFGWAAAALLALLLLLSSGSRGGLLGLAGALGLGALLALWQGGPRVRIWAALALIGGVLLATSHPRMRETLTSVARTEQKPSDSDLERRSMITAGLRMASDRWLLGWGPATTPSVFPGYRPQLGISLENSFQLHSQPVTLAAEGGLVALAGTLLVLIGLARQTRRALLQGPPELAIPVRATAISLSGYLVFLCTDTQLDVAFFAMITAVAAAMLWACGESTRNHSPTRSGQRAWPIVTLAALVLTMALTGPAIVSSARNRLSLAHVFDAFDAGQMETFRERLHAHAKAHPGDFVSANVLAWAEYEAMLRTDDPGKATQHRQAAAAAWEHSLRARPQQELPHSNLGWLRLGSEPGQALLHFRAAARLVPDKRGSWLGQAVAQLRQGSSLPEVVPALAQECLRNPDFVLSPLWRQPGFADAWASVSVALRATLATIAGDPTRPQWIAAEATDFQLLLDWREGTRDAATLSRQLSAARRRECFEAWIAPADARLANGHAAVWQLLAQAHAAGDKTPARMQLLRAAHARLTGHLLNVDAPLLALLETRVASGWPARLSFQSETARHALRYQRPGYAILVRNTDLPLMSDVYPAEQGALDAYLTALFPRKGWCLPLEEGLPSLPPASPRP